MKPNALVIFAVLLGTPLMGQKYCTNERYVKAEEQARPKSPEQRLQGSYQIRVHNPDASVILTEDLLKTVQAQRKEDQAVEIPWDEFSSLYIPSRREVESPDFKPLTTLVYTQK